MRALATFLVTLAFASPAAGADWSGFYAGIFGGLSRIEGQHPRWPQVPLAGVVDGNMPLFGPTGGSGWEAFALPSGNISEIGGVVGYMRQLDSTPLLWGVEASVGGASNDNGWGASQSVTSEIGIYSSRGTNRAWYEGGPSLEFLLRGGLKVHDSAAIFLNGGVVVDGRGLAFSYDRWGPGTMNWGSWDFDNAFVPLPGTSATLSVKHSPDWRIAPVIGASAEVEISNGWRMRVDYQAKFVAAQSLTIDINRTTTDPVNFPAASDTAVLNINGYTTHTARIGIIKSFSVQ